MSGTTVEELKTLYIKLGGSIEDLNGLQTDAEIIDKIEDIVKASNMPDVTGEDVTKSFMVNGDGTIVDIYNPISVNDVVIELSNVSTITRITKHGITMTAKELYQYLFNRHGMIATPVQVNIPYDTISSRVLISGIAFFVNGATDLYACCLLDNGYLIQLKSTSEALTIEKSVNLIPSA